MSPQTPGYWCWTKIGSYHIVRGKIPPSSSYVGGSWKQSGGNQESRHRSLPPGGPSCWPLERNQLIGTSELGVRFRGSKTWSNGNRVIIKRASFENRPRVAFRCERPIDLYWETGLWLMWATVERQLRAPTDTMADSNAEIDKHITERFIVNQMLGKGVCSQNLLVTLTLPGLWNCLEMRREE